MATLNITYESDMETRSVFGKRHYVTPGGQLYPSMTTVLSPYKEKELQSWVKRVGEAEAEKIRTKAANIGTGMHTVYEDYIRGKPLEMDPLQKVRFRGMKPIIDQSIGKVYGLETALYSDTLKLAGRTDVIAEYEGVPSVIDWKNARMYRTAKQCDGYFMQGAGYAYMWYERTKDTITTPRQVVIIISVEHEAIPQVFVEKISDWLDPLRKLVSDYHNTKVVV